MTVKLLLDTSYCLALIGRRSHALLTAFEAFAPGEIAVSSLTVAALQERVQKSRFPERNRRALEQFLLPLAIVDFDTAAAEVLGRITANWSPRSISADSHALLLAAHAQRLNAVLITVAPEHYRDVPDLMVNSGLGRNLADEAGAATSMATDTRRTGVIYAFGSHDVTLDLLADQLNALHPHLALVSAHVGSLGGLLALQQRQAHLAGSHLLDEESGDYNVGHIRRILTEHGVHVVLVAFVTRVQGLIVAQHNPKQVHDLADLARDDVAFVNRQPGSGTRVLLDHHLHAHGIDPAAIAGYAREESSHLAVASAVASGEVDCGLGIEAVAANQGLDFVPLFSERYDLVIPAEHYASRLLAPLIALVQQPPASFVRRVEALGGYDARQMGRVLAEL